MRFLISLLTLIVVSLQLVGANDFSRQDLNYELKRIDKILQKELPRDASIDDIAKALERLHNSSSNGFLRDDEKYYTLANLADLAKYLNNEICPNSARQIRRLEAGLGEPEKSSWIHIDHYIESVANRVALRCKSLRRYIAFRYSSRLFHRPEFDKINDYLSKMDNNNEIPGMMAELRTLYEPLDEDVRFKEAIKSLLSLERLDEEDRVICDPRDQDMLFLNALGARSGDERFAKRPINRLVDHYIQKNLADCSEPKDGSEADAMSQESSKRLRPRISSELKYLISVDDLDDGIRSDD